MYNVIFKRRSVRFFKSNPISKVDMREILRAGMWAPSAKNRQPWKYIVYTGKEKDRLPEAMEEGLNEEQRDNRLLPRSADMYRSGLLCG